MIELRWFHKAEVPIESHSEWGDRIYAIRVLQYRWRRNWVKAIYLNISKWSDWKDVPEVHEDR